MAVSLSVRNRHLLIVALVVAGLVAAALVSLSMLSDSSRLQGYRLMLS